MAGHGGGAWKVAYADFVTAMMAFFMVMWIVGQSKAVKQAVSQYFQDPSGYAAKAGAAMVPGKGGNDSSLMPSSKPRPGNGVLPGTSPIPKTGGKVRVKPTQPDEDPKGELVKANARKRIKLTRTGDSDILGGTVEFGDAAVALDARQRSKLKVIAGDLAGRPHMIEVLGHTSNRPVPGDAPLKDRKDLTYARCRYIAELLESMKIDPKRIRLVVGDHGMQPAPRSGSNKLLDCQVDVYMIDLLMKEAEVAADTSRESRGAEAK